MEMGMGTTENGKKGLKRRKEEEEGMKKNGSARGKGGAEELCELELE
jgi:hypothetical protein